MRQRTGRKLSVLAAVLLTVCAAVLGGSLESVADPDLTNNVDFLQGNRQLRNDSVIVTIEYRDLDNNAVLAETLPFSTTDSQIVGYSWGFDRFPALPTPRRTSVVAARMFNLPWDTIVTLNTKGHLWVFDQQRFDPPYSTPGCLRGDDCFADHPTSFEGVNYESLVVAKADFNRDGYDDVLVMTVDPRVGMLRIITAKDPNKPEAGVVYGPLLPFSVHGAEQPQFTEGEVAVGDFNGDGHPEIAAVLTASAATLWTFRVVPSTLQIFVVAGLDLPRNTGIRSLAAGRFTSAAHDLLLVASGFTDDSAPAHVEVIDFDPVSLQPSLISRYISGVSGPFGALAIRSGRFQWGSPFEQAVLGLFPADKARAASLGILGLDETRHVNAAPAISFQEDVHCGLTVGNFDRMQPNPQPPPAKQRDFNLQVARMGCDSRGPDVRDGPFIAIYNVDQTQNFSMSVASTYRVHYAAGTSPETYAMTAGDAEGRSVVLGNPTVIQIPNWVRTDVILGAPPMHVDYVKKDNNPAPTLFNVTVLPEDFATVYQMSTESEQASSRENQFSYTWGVQEEFEQKVTWGDPDATTIPEGASIGIKQSMMFARDQMTKDFYEGYARQSLEITSAAEFHDFVWYTTQDFSMYLYPIIGRTACPDTGTTQKCPDSERKPLYAHFAGASNIKAYDSDGSQLEWYQPPWEPGNILSYPATEDHLKLLSPGVDGTTTFDFLTERVTFTTSQDTEYKTTWASGASSASSVGFEQNFDLDVGVTATGVLTGVVAGSRVDASITGSYKSSIGETNTSRTTVGQSQGVIVKSPGRSFFANQDLYAYRFTPYIFGSTPPTGIIDGIPARPVNIRGFGSLRAAFVVEPTGDWWTFAYPLPDVALNRPSRWQIKPGKSSQETDNCLTGKSDEWCVEANVRNAEQPWLSPFHHMRGFFIMNKAAVVAKQPLSAAGPQMEAARVNDDLVLAARVYNFSLAAMDTRSKVHVRFYAQPMDVTTPGGPYPAGESFLINNDDVVVGPIPPFSTNTNPPLLNWVLATTSFKPGPELEGKTLAFWVLVWMEVDGQVVVEMDGRGLAHQPTKAPPRPGKLESLADADRLIEQYSNNLGFYNWKFFICPEDLAKGCKPTPPAPLSSSATPGAPPQAHRRSTFWLGPVEVSPTNRFRRGENVEVRTNLLGGVHDVQGLNILFYDGDPQNGGKLFDMERVPNVPAGTHHSLAVHFHSTKCGERTVFVVAQRGSFQRVRQSEPVTVECGP